MQKLKDEAGFENGMLQHENKEFIKAKDNVRKLKRIVIAYRSNDVYDSLFEKVLAELKDLKKEVVFIKFPQKLGDIEIGVIIEENKSLFSDVLVICDRTVKNVLNSIGTKESNEILIDNIYDKAISSFIYNAGIKNTYVSRDSYEEVCNILKYGISEGIINPTKIYVLTEKLGDHYGGCSNELEIASKIARQIIETLMIETVVVKNVPNDIGPTELLLADRHVKGIYFPISKNMLRLPADSLFDDLLTVGIKYSYKQKLERDVVEHIKNQLNSYNFEKEGEVIDFNVNEELEKHKMKTNKLTFTRDAVNFISSNTSQLVFSSVNMKKIIHLDPLMIGVVNCKCETGSAYGFDVLYLVWRNVSEDKINCKRLIDSTKTKDILEVKDIYSDDENIHVVVYNDGIYSENSFEKVISVSRKELVSQDNPQNEIILPSSKDFTENVLKLNKMISEYVQHPIARALLERFSKQVEDGLLSDADEVLKFER